MSEAKHTPGPWSIQEYSNFSGWSVSAPVRGCIAERWYPTSDAVERIYPKDEMAANARLIAAAPEMLEALRRMAARFLCTHPDDVAIAEQARAAIAKAEGGAS